MKQYQTLKTNGRVLELRSEKGMVIKPPTSGPLKDSNAHYHYDYSSKRFDGHGHPTVHVHPMRRGSDKDKENLH